MILPPIALFTYNRPEKAIQVLQALKSQGATRLYIYCDGAKDDLKDRLFVQENIDVVESFPLENKHIFIAEKNKGLANSIVDGISNAFEFENQLIILEDDCLPFGQMLHFMADNLEYWQEFDDIFSISAYHFIREPRELDIPFDVYFSNRFLPWGWATWKDRWQAVLPGLKSKKNPYGSFGYVPDIAGRDLLYHSYAVERKMVDSWAIPLGLITLHKGYRHIMPSQPLVNNTGMDDSGTNTSSAHNRIAPVSQAPRYSFPLNMCPRTFHDCTLEKQFIDSLDVMLPPEWLKDKVLAEMQKPETQR